ncbi:MAG TPA: NAD(P)-dependent oxidoreductase [Pseudonocardiaceae bacterium]|jgi:3-hydroxyisobutyrate dehydrogenase-like beta-hydroxyacid dehydrogenase
MAVTRVALLGLGRMGAPMAAHLVRARHATRVWNRSAAGHRRLADELAVLGVSAVAEHAATPDEAVRDADVVLTVLADAAALGSVLFGPHGVAGAVGPGAVVCDLGTIGVAEARAQAAELAVAGVSFVDAPVSGSVAGARSRSLLVMAGGEPDVVDRATPVLESLATRVLRVGDTGAGQAMKLAVNSVLHTLNAAIGESLVLAERGGVPRRTALEVLAGSAVAAPYVVYQRACFADPDGQPVAFTVDLMRKDIDLILRFAGSRSSPMPLAEVVRAVADQASGAGLGERDMSTIAELHRRR